MRPRFTRRVRILVGIGLSLGFAFLLTIHVLAAGITGVDSFRQAVGDPNFAGVFAVNILVGLSFLLFVVETGRGTIRVVLTIAAALLIGFGITLLISGDPVQAYRALLTGPVSRLNRWGNWINDTLSLVLVGLALALVFRARLFSLGADGQITLGALAAGVVALGLTGLPAAIHVPLALVAGGLAGFLWGLVPGYLRAYLDANELVSTLMLNPIAALGYELALTALKPASAGYIVSAPFPDSALLPPVVSGTRVTTGIVFVAAAVILAWLLIQRTPLGYELRMIGANLRFAQYGGIDTKRSILLIMAVSGILAGLTGGYLALATQRRLILGISAGLTFEGVVVALLARNNPLAIPAMALLYSFLRVGGPIMQTDANVSADIVRLIQAIIILLFTADGLVALVSALVSRRARLVRDP